MYALSTDLLISGWPVDLSQTPQHKYPWALSISSTHTQTHTHTHTHTLSPWIMQSKQLASQQGGSAVWPWRTFVVSLNQKMYSHEHTLTAVVQSRHTSLICFNLHAFYSSDFKQLGLFLQVQDFTTSVNCVAEVTTEVCMLTSPCQSSASHVRPC